MQKALSEAGIDFSVWGEATSEPSVGFFDNLARTLNLKDYDALVHAVESYFLQKSNIVTEMFSLQAIEEDHLPAIVKGTLNSFQTANNPREITADDIVRIAEKLR